MRRTFFLILLTGLVAYAPYQCKAESSTISEKPEGQRNTLQVVKDRGKLIARVTSQEPPFGFVDKNGKLNGIEIDIAQALAKKIFDNPLQETPANTQTSL